MRMDIKNNIRIILITTFLVAIIIIGTLFNINYSHQINKQDYSEPVYGTGTLDGWVLQFDMYTNKADSSLIF